MFHTSVILIISEFQNIILFLLLLPVVVVVLLLLLLRLLLLLLLLLLKGVARGGPGVPVSPHFASLF